MAEISGVPTTDIDSVDGFFTTQGGSGISPYSLPASGVNGSLLIGGGSIPANPLVTPDFNIGPLASVSFVKIISGVANTADSTAFLGLTSNGELWYNLQPNVIWKSWATADGTWRRYGTATDYDDISVEPDGGCFAAIRSGVLWFVGYGANGQRGDGSTASSSSWIVVNNSLTWASVSLGMQKIGAVDSNGHAYFSGRQYDYMTGQGTTSGTLTTLTREQNSLTGVTYIFCGPYRTSLIIASGNLYVTGRNYNYKGGGLVGSGTINGPTLGDNSGDFVSIQCNYWCSMAITTTGTLRFAGSASYKPRPDGGGNQSTSSNAFDVIDGGATGYTYFYLGGKSSDGQFPAFAIKSGQLKMGGGSYSYGVKVALGFASNNNWVDVGYTGAISAASSKYVNAASW